MAGKKLSDAEIAIRVEDCYNLRFNHNYGVRQWLDHCHKTYGDKSEQQYTQYWMETSNRYNDNWKERLNKAIDPAVNELYSLLASDDSKIRQRAVDQIMKYTGHDIQKIEGDFKVEQISLQWGTTDEKTE